MKRVLLLGPPGAGKGTQAGIIADRLSVPAISTGDVFRANVREGTELGLQVRGHLDAGDLVPDGITVAMLFSRLAESDASEGFVLDGFPRTIAQAELLRDMLADQGRELHHVIEFVVEEDALITRLSTRRVLIDGAWVQRDDDKPETVRHRLDVFRAQTAPLSAFYERGGLLTRIDANADVEEVSGRVLQLLRAPRPTTLAGGGRSASR